jgi:5'-3' exonuclease
MLVQVGEADCVVTDDYDALPCGASRVIRNLDSGKRKMEEVFLDRLLSSLQLTYSEFVDMCILAGSDFTVHIPNLGPARAYSGIRAHKTIEEYLKRDSFGRSVASNPELLALFDFVEARARFMAGGSVLYENIVEGDF